MNLCIAHGGDLGRPSGGLDRVTAFASGLVDRGHAVTVVAPRPSGELPDDLSAVDVVTTPIRPRGLLDQPLRAALVVRRARRVASDRDARLQLVHSTLGGVAALLGTSGYVLDMHDCAFASPLYGELPFGGHVQRAIGRLEGRGVGEAAHVLVVSERMRDLLDERWGVPADRTTVVPNGYFPHRVEPYRDVATVDDRVVFLGTLHPKVDVEALVAVAASQPVEELVVVGDGPKLARLREARAAADDASIRLTGRLPTARAMELVASAAVAVAPQIPSETVTASSPVKLYTYAALGLPIVATAGPEFAADLAERGAGEVVAPGGAFVEAVDALLADDDRRARMAAAALEAGTPERWDRRVEQVAAVYDGL